MKVGAKALNLDRSVGMENLIGEIEWERELVEALRGLFLEKEGGPCDRERASAEKLAYLAYTGKVENFVRDELAYRLNQQLIGRAEVGREVDRVDLVAIGNNGQLALALQAKAIYCGDLLSQGRWRPKPHSLLNNLAEDLHCKCCATFQNRIGLLLVTHIAQGESPRNDALLAYPKVVKRASRIMANGSGWQVLRANLRTYLQETVSTPGSPAPLSLQCVDGSWSGSAFGAQVEVHWFLVRP